MLLAIDPGDHGGWVASNPTLIGGTLPKSYRAYGTLIEYFKPKIEAIIVESFQLYSSKAKAQSGETFFTCEAIGIIKYLADLYSLNLVLQQPSVKPFIPQTYLKEQRANIQPLSPELVPIHPQYIMRKRTGISEHTYDALAHLIYYQRRICFDT